jgi:hypothetical protein
MEAMEGLEKGTVVKVIGAAVAKSILAEVMEEVVDMAEEGENHNKINII